MEIISPSFALMDEIDARAMLRRVERAGRVCYKSEDRATEESARGFVARIIKSGHESVIEHEKITVHIVCDRGVSHELVRHRIASYSQESTRYCNYTRDKFGRGLTFIRPCFWAEDAPEYALWLAAMQAAEDAYLALIGGGASPDQARSVLPNSLKTEIVVTMNLRAWRHFFKLRTAKGAHPQMREIAVPLLRHFSGLLPDVFGDIAPYDA